MALTDDQMVAVVRRTVDLYEDAERVILERISRSMAAGIDAPDWATAKLLELQLVQARLRKDLGVLGGKASAEISSAVGDAYNRGQIVALGSLGRVLPSGTGPNPFVSQAAVALVRETVEGVTGQHAQILRSVADVYRNVIAEVVGIKAAGAATQRDLAQAALARFAEKGITGFVDSSGRRWSMGAYTEMAMRTATHNASEVGHTERLRAEGHDLVIVSDHAQECPACAKWEGRVLSLSGTYDRGHPQKQRDGDVRVLIAGTLDDAKRAGYGHPGCRHRLVAYFPGITKVPTRKGDPDDHLLRSEQRRLERGVKAWRRREAAALSPVEAAQARARARAWGERLRAHEAEHGLKRQPWRTAGVRPGAGPVPAPRAPVASPEAAPPLVRSRNYETVAKQQAVLRKDGKWDEADDVAQDWLEETFDSAVPFRGSAMGYGLPDDLVDVRNDYVMKDKRTLTMLKAMRAGRPMTPAMRDVERMIASTKVREPVEVYRGAVLPEPVVGRLTPGAKWVDPAFQSTDVNRTSALAYAEGRRARAGAAGRTVLFEMELSEGTEAAWVGYGEVVVQRGVEFTVAAVEESGDVLVVRLRRL